MELPPHFRDEQTAQKGEVSCPMCQVTLRCGLIPSYSLFSIA